MLEESGPINVLFLLQLFEKLARAVRRHMFCFVFCSKFNFYFTRDIPIDIQCFLYKRVLANAAARKVSLKRTSN